MKARFLCKVKLQLMMFFILMAFVIPSVAFATEPEKRAGSPPYSGILSTIIAEKESGTPQKSSILRQGYTEAEYQAFLEYRLLKVGCKGEDVVRLKARMYELGYFKNKTNNDTYTETTAEYVNEFLRTNGYSSPNGTMTPEQQLLFYSKFAITKQTPKVYERYSYKDIARNANSYIGLLCKFTTRVVQQIDIPGSSDIELLLVMNGNTEQLLYGYVEGFKDWKWGGSLKETGVARLLVNDKIEIECELLGEYTFQSTDGKWYTVPLVSIDNMTLYD